MKIRSGRIELAVQAHGDAGRTPVVLVHGYPDNQSVWDAVLPYLMADYFVITYDVRGAGASDAPTRTADYRIEHLVGDLAAVIDALCPDRPVHLVAHDWGSMQHWESVTTERLRGRIASYTSISGPSLDHSGFWMRDRWRRGWAGKLQVLRQLQRSWYMWMYQLPLLAPLLWKWGFGRRWPDYMRRVEKTHVEPRPTQARDGANGVSLYRANILQRLLNPQPRYAHAPVQLVVALHDKYLDAELLAGLDRWVPQLRRVEIDGGHWLPLTQPEQLARCIREFVDSSERLTDSAATNRASGADAATVPSMASTMQPAVAASSS